MNIVAVQVVIQFIPQNSPVELETEFFQTNILSRSMALDECVTEDIACSPEMFTDQLAQLGYPAGIYSLIGLFSYSSGRDADTPNGPGEYWTDLSPLGELHITHLTREEFLGFDDTTTHTEEDFAALFPAEPAEILLRLPR